MSNEALQADYRKPHVFDPIHNDADECECGLLAGADIHESDSAYAERMRPRIVNAPDRIWLQVGCDDEVGEIDWSELSHPDVSWCAEKINNTDIEYTRVSAASTAPVVDELKLNNDEIGALINYNLRKLGEAPCKESARVFRTRAERLRAIYEN